jgi:D-glycero-D-manno-heptose 1,7-bisphosphate phosphatase
VFLDRDGVLVDAVMRDSVASSPRSVDEFVVLPGAAEAIAELHAVGARCLVVTNQPDVSRGKLDRRQLSEMNDALRRELGVDDVLCCPHDGRDGCACRKPLPGLLERLARRHDVDLSMSWMVGDRWVDIAAGAAAGARTILIDRPYSWAATSSGAPGSDLRPDHRASDLLAAARIIVADGDRAPSSVEPHHITVRNIAAEERTP